MSKATWIYGLSAGLLLLLLEVIHFKTMIHDLSLEIFGAIIALIFLGVGILISKVIIKRKAARQMHIENSKAASLSPREQDVLILIAQGFSNQEIADKIFVSVNTTKTHISKIYQKLNVTRRTQAVSKAQQLGIIDTKEVGNS